MLPCDKAGVVQITLDDEEKKLMSISILPNLHCRKCFFKKRPNKVIAIPPEDGPADGVTDLRKIES